jgi:hypothetical protein
MPILFGEDIPCRTANAEFRGSHRQFVPSDTRGDAILVDGEEAQLYRRGDDEEIQVDPS